MLQGKGQPLGLRIRCVVVGIWGYLSSKWCVAKWFVGSGLFGCQFTASGLGSRGWAG